MLGAVVGSFIATLVLRAGEGRSISGRSACDGCGKTLAPWELIPLVSWAIQRGRCRRCSTRIDPFHPVTELHGALLGFKALSHAPNLGGGALLLFGLLLLTLALFDARYFWLPHWLSALTAAAGLAFGGIAMGSLGIAVSLHDRIIGTLAGFVALWTIAAAYRLIRGRQGLGGGDAPMFAAIGAWLGWAMLPMVLLFAALAGLSVALVRLVSGPKTGDWQTMRLPLGTLMAIAVLPTLWLTTALHHYSTP